MINPLSKSAERIEEIGADIKIIAKYWQESKKNTARANWQVIESLKLQLKDLTTQHKRLHKAVTALEKHALAHEKPENQKTLVPLRVPIVARQTRHGRP